MSSRIRQPEGLLLDLDGTLYESEAPIPGATKALNALRAAGMPLRFVTNTSRRSRGGVAARMQSMGIDLQPEELFTAPLAAAAWLREARIQNIALCLPRPAYEDFGDFEISDVSPEAVVVGDLGSAWTFERLNQAFRWLLGGAELLAIQKNRYWKAKDDLSLDAGPFVAALEFASGKTATVVGKPCPRFFEAAAHSMGLEASSVAMVGDDLENDVGGAQAAGAVGIQVRTGKYRPDDQARSGLRPDLLVDSIAALPALLLD